MSNYIIDKDININGNITISDSVIYINSLDEFNKYKENNSVISIGNLNIDGNLIICCYDNCSQIIFNGDVTTINTITL